MGEEMIGVEKKNNVKVELSDYWSNSPFICHEYFWSTYTLLFFFVLVQLLTLFIKRKAEQELLLRDIFNPTFSLWGTK